MSKRSCNGPDRHGKHARAQCYKCGESVRSDVLAKHLATHNPTVQCPYCKKDIREDRLEQHKILCRENVDVSLCNRHVGVHQPIDLEEGCSSISGFFKCIDLNIESSMDYQSILSRTCDVAREKLVYLVANYPVKAQLVVHLSFYKISPEGREEAEKCFRSACEPIIMGDNIDDFLNRAKSYITVEIVGYERQGSGWIFEKHHHSTLDVAKYSPLSASGSVEIPSKLKKMRSVLNIESKDNKCFLYCILAKLYPAKKHAARSSSYKDKISTISMGSVEFPVPIKRIGEIEKLNNLSISVFEWSTDDQEHVVPLRHGANSGTRIDLLYLQDEHTAHYLLIKDFDAFMRHRSSHHNSMNHCRRCLHGFTSSVNLNKHIIYCQEGINSVTKMPEEGKIEFKATHKQDKKLFSVYFDFECLTVPIQKCENNPGRSSTIKYQKHTPCSFSIVTTSVFKDYKEEVVVFSDPDPKKVTNEFIMELYRLYEDMMTCYEDNQYPINMTGDDEKRFKNSKICHICKKDLDWKSKKNYPVRDHDHTCPTNNFRGAAHNVCNINYFNRSKKIPAFAHNLKGYDMQLFLRDLINHADEINVIPENIEKFKAIFTENFIFLDSCSFLSTSLDKLVENLKTSGLDKFKRLKKEFPEHNDILTQKGEFFYDYATDFSVFSQSSLPPKEAFYSKLKETHITDEQYNHAKNVWDQTGCETLLDYMHLYVKTDAVLLCDVFENFRDLCLEYYDLDCCHYMSLPGFSWDAMLKMTEVKLELITDKDVYTFLEDNIRGGVTTINHREFTANNPYLDEYDESKPSSYIHYVDANNLYGASMCRKLPVGDFKWLIQGEIDQLDLLNIDPEGEKMHILEVDLHYPDSLHDSHTDYPLAVESKLTTKEQISPYNRAFLDEHKEKFCPSRKLIPDLHDKKNYVCSLRNLQLFLKQGLQLTKIHRVLTATQENFMGKYIDFNSDKRQKSKSKFEQDLFKLLNNSAYGKFIEGIRKRTDVKIVRNERTARKLTKKPQFMGFQILEEDITIVQAHKRTVTLNKPIACGFMVLENAKNIMYSFWYDVLKPKYQNNIKLILSDTDSFIYAVDTEDGYRDLYSMRDLMDLSGYRKDTVLGRFLDAGNRKVPGKFSDEKPLEIIREVIALKPKMYSVSTKKLLCGKDHVCTPKCFVGHSVTAKGVSKTAQRSISHQDYRDVLHSRGTTMTTTKTIRSYSHNLYSIKVNKRGLSAYDDKKFIMDNGVETLSYGHYKLK